MENILVYNVEDETNKSNKSQTQTDGEQSVQVKITDFGTSLFMKKMKNEASKESIVLTAPEALNGNFSSKSDIWSAGVIMYMLLSSKYPFDKFDNRSDIILNLINNEIEFQEAHSPIVRELLKEIFIKNPVERADINYILDHQALSSPSEDNSLIEENKKIKMVEVLNNISGFFVGKNLRHVVLNYMCSQKLYSEASFELSKLFQEADVNHDGYLDAVELYSNYNKFFPGTTEDQKSKLKEFISNVDINKNGKLDYSEFMLITSTFYTDNSKSLLKEVFDYFDENRNGYIEIKDLAKVLKQEKFENERLQEMIDEFDQNSDGQISFDEFYNLIEKYN